MTMDYPYDMIKKEDYSNYYAQSTFTCTFTEPYQYTSAVNNMIPLYCSSSPSSSSTNATDILPLMEPIIPLTNELFSSSSSISHHHHHLQQFHHPTKKARVKDNGKKKCTNCGATKTPSWRRSIEGSKLLCNACGLYEKVNGRKRIVYIQRDGSAKVARGNNQYRTQQICFNCGTTDPKCWQNYKKDVQCDICSQNPIQYDIVHDYH
ncbi:unnamed protein product [Cunninghamella blakesleeana]